MVSVALSQSFSGGKIYGDPEFIFCVLLNLLTYTFFGISLNFLSSVELY